MRILCARPRGVNQPKVLSAIHICWTLETKRYIEQRFGCRERPESKDKGLATLVSLVEPTASLHDLLMADQELMSFPQRLKLIKEPGQWRAGAPNNTPTEIVEMLNKEIDAAGSFRS